MISTGSSDFITKPFLALSTFTDFGNAQAAKGGVMGNTAAHGGLNEGYQGTRIAPIPTGLGVGQRALQAGGFAGGQTTIEQFNMVTTGNASQFGNRAVGSYELSAMSNTTRCLFAGGEAGDDGDTDRIEYVEFASQGNGADFGN